ncbi:MAG: hypothetical protein Q9224_005682 [Gallowayella concinna]
MSTPDADYRQMVAMMADKDIKAENENRRVVRQSWRKTENFRHLEDPWKYIRRGKDLLFDESTSERRRSLQLELIDAIFSHPQESQLDRYLRRGLPAIACWLGLIGLRLAEFFTSSEAAIKQVEVLIECIWVCNSSRSARVCDVLWACYRRGILEQPDFDRLSDSRESLSDLRHYIVGIRVTVYLLNVLYKHQSPLLVNHEGLEDVWSVTISKIEESMREERVELDMRLDRSIFFSVTDFGLRDLQEIGKLQVKWTAYWDEHLELETIGPLTTLKLYWFSPTLSRFFHMTGLCGSLVEAECLNRGEEVLRTLELVFKPYGMQDKFKKHYADLEAPGWLGLFAHEELENWHPKPGDEAESTLPLPLSRFQVYWEGIKPKYCCEVKDHMISPNRTSPDIERITLARYPFYHHRLLELRSYMDSRQTRGFQALWRDRRNSNVYYTFWLAIIFGALGVFFGVCTLAVAILQAWGQLQSLHD